MDEKTRFGSEKFTNFTRHDTLKFVLFTQKFSSMIDQNKK